jgi:hypothetical protein
VTFPDDVEVTIDRRRFAGVWANACKAIAHTDEVTIDFIRVDPREPRDCRREDHVLAEVLPRRDRRPRTGLARFGVAVGATDRRVM